jgi:hypothetical protein
MTIREHPLAWRWTDPKYALLPDSTLAQMQPIEPEEAARLCTHSLTLAGENGLAPNVFTITSVCAEGFSQEAGCRWLRECQPDLSVHVVISWDQDTAIRTTWEVFTAHWDDFCYPSSDDVVVWSESDTWAILYHHEHEFQFGKRSAA